MRRAQLVWPVSVSLCLPFVAGCPVCQTDDDCGPCETCIGRAACVPLELGQCCQGDAECNDGDPCTADTCSNGTCQNTAISCPPGQSCVNGVCMGCTSNAQCNDNNACTTDDCVNTVCLNTPKVCNDDDPCTTDSCNRTAGCVFTPIQCLTGACDPHTGQCVECLLVCASDAECDDNHFCNGRETCIGGCCVSGTPPCPLEECCEDRATCECCTTDDDCDDGQFCNGLEFCEEGTCRSCETPCLSGLSCNETNDLCVPNGAATDDLRSAEWICSSLITGVDTGVYRFTAQAAQRAVIQVSNTTEWAINVCIELLPPGGGAAVASDCDDPHLFTGRIAYPLTASGQYTIVIRDYDGANAGPFCVSLLILPGPTVSERDRDGSSICSGQSRFGTIDVNADLDAYTFSGQAGQRAIIQVSNTAEWAINVCVELFPPGGGAAVASDCDDPHLFTGRIEYPLTASGQYTIVIRDYDGANSGDYGLSLVIIP